MSGIASTSLRSGRCHASWSISSSTWRPSRNRIRISATTARPWTNPDVGSNSSSSAPPSPEREPGQHERRGEREEAPPRRARRPARRARAARRRPRAAPRGTRPLRRSAARGELCQTVPARLATVVPSMRRAAAITTALLALALPSAASAQRAVPVASARSRAAGRCAWSRPPRRRRRRPRPRRRRPRARRPVGAAAPRPAAPRRRPATWHRRACRACSTRARSRRSIPAPCAATASPSRGPPTPRGFSWLLRFESVRRNAAVFLNGRRIGRNVGPLHAVHRPGARAAARAGRTSSW